MRLLAFLAFAMLVGGCAAPPAKEPLDPVAVAQPKEIAFDDAAFEATGLALTNEDGDWLAVGDPLSRAQEYFPAPKNAKRHTDLPPGLKTTQFRVWGWQAKNDGFGCITDRAGRVVLAMHSRGNQQESSLEVLLDRYEAKIGSPPERIGQNEVIVEFWGQDKAHHLMISAVTNRSGGYTVTSAVGHQAVMKVIGAYPENAAKLVRDGQSALGEAGKPKSGES